MSVATNEPRSATPGLSGQFAKKLLMQVGAILSLAIVRLAPWIAYRTLHAIQLTDVVAHVRALPAAAILLAFAATAGSYAAGGAPGS